MLKTFLIKQQSVDQYPAVILESCLATVISWYTGTRPTETARGSIILPLIYVWEENQITHCALLWCLALLERDEHKRKRVGDETWEGQITERERESRLEQQWREQTGETTRGETNISSSQGKCWTLWNGTDRENVCTCPTLFCTRGQELLLSSLFLTLSLTSSLAGFINRPLRFQSRPQRASDSLKERSETQKHWGRDGRYSIHIHIR